MKADRTFKVFRLTETDRVAIQSLTTVANPSKSRFDAMIELVDVVAKMSLAKIEVPNRRPMKLAIPNQLDAAIRRAKKRSGHSYASILLAAIQSKTTQQSSRKRGRPRKV